MTRVSVIIPSHNHASFIKEAVDSVLEQTESDLELIVVDDGSTDRSLETLSTISDRRMCVIRQENQGAHSAINHGLALASGKFLAILDSDDSYHPRRLEKAIEALERYENAGLVGSYIHIIDTQNRRLGIKHGYQDCEPWLLDNPERSFRAGSDLRAALLTENYWSTTSNFVFPRNWFEQIGVFRPLRFTHDWDFALRMAKVAKLVLLPEPLINYRVHDSNTIRQDQAAMIFEICWCLAMHLPTHIADLRFFQKLPLDTRVEQLLQSIFVFDCERVLSVMLLQRLADNPAFALQLLDPENLVRIKFLDFIEERLHSQSGKGSASRRSPDRLSTAAIYELRKLRAWLRKVSR
jgi:glycosyltransferase involved in cell wall biosynthesis